MKASKVIGAFSLMFVMVLPSPSEGYEWSKWSKWSSCDINTGLMSRFRMLGSKCVTNYHRTVEASHSYCEDPVDPKLILFPQGPIKVGDTITMICHADLYGRQPDAYTWRKHEARGKLSSPHSTSTADQDYIFSKKVELADSGRYSCQAIYGEDEKSSNEFELTIHDFPIPTITGWPEHSTVDVGESLSLTCAATTAGSSADHDLSYSWYKDSAELRGSKADIYWKLEVDLSDAGEYSCQVKSGGITRNSTVKTLFVRGETWSWNCSTTWTRWMSRDPDTNMEYRNQFCVEISSQGRIRNWKLEEENCTKQGGCVAVQPTASQRVENSQNKAEVILAITLTFIMLLVVAVVVLVVFLVRLKRSLHDREPRAENVAFHAESNGSGPAVKVKDRKIPEAKSNFDPYAALGDKNVYVDDDYGSLGEQKRIARPQGEKDNAAFETEDGDYLDIIGEGRMVSPSLQAELEDGYRGNEADAPVYHVLEHEPSNVPSDNRNEGAVYSLAEVTDPRSDQGVESVYASEERNGDVYAIPDKNKTGKGGAPVYSLAGRTRPEPAPGKTTSCDKETPDTKYSLAGTSGGKPQPSQSLAGKLNDDSADYSQLYGRAPGAKYPDKNKMAAKGGQGKALPSNGDGDEYSRLQLPTLTKPSTMQFVEKKPKQMKGVNSAQEDAQGDDDEDYEYSTACEVIT